MSISYEKLNNLIESKGISLRSLYKNGVITHYAYSRISKGEPVSLEHIANICIHLDVKIEDVVEVIKD